MIPYTKTDFSSIGPHDISRIAQAWVERYQTMNLSDESSAYHENGINIWIVGVMFDLVREYPEKTFLVIDEVLRQTDNEAVLCNLAAGPLESLLMRYGEGVMPQIEYRAKNSSKFRDLFSWMYPVTSEELWERIMALVGDDFNHD